MSRWLGVHSQATLEGKLLSLLPAPYPTPTHPRKANSRSPTEHQAQPALLPSLPETIITSIAPIPPPRPATQEGQDWAREGAQPSLKPHQLSDGRSMHHQLLIAIQEQLESSQVGVFIIGQLLVVKKL